MPGQIRAVPGTNTIYAVMQATLFHADGSSLWQPNWVYERRTPKTDWRRSWTWEGGRWPARSGFYIDLAASTCLILGQSQVGSVNDAEPWEPPALGCHSQKYIMGQCQNSGGTPLGGAVVQGFRTSDDYYVGETVTNDQGNYELACPQSPNDQHYLVAYYDASPDLAGTTVNTLVPTWHDGSV